MPAKSKIQKTLRISKKKKRIPQTHNFQNTTTTTKITKNSNRLNKQNTCTHRYHQNTSQNTGSAPFFSPKTTGKNKFINKKKTELNRSVMTGESRFIKIDEFCRNFYLCVVPMENWRRKNEK